MYLFTYFITYQELEEYLVSNQERQEVHGKISPN